MGEQREQTGVLITWSVGVHTNRRSKEIRGTELSSESILKSHNDGLHPWIPTVVNFIDCVIDCHACHFILLKSDSFYLFFSIGTIAPLSIIFSFDSEC